MLKVVSSEEMARIEKIAYASNSNASPREYMINAGKGIAEAVEDFILLNALEKEVTILIGKGNNGGDAYAAGSILLGKGFTVTAIQLFSIDQCTSLCQEQNQHFQNVGGKNVSFPFRFPREGIVLDGIVGTGFRGKAEGIILEAIQAANHSGLPILAIDIPSGLNGNNGAVESEAIIAAQTVCLGLPKIGFFLDKGWDHIGELKQVDFGLDREAIKEAKETACLFHPDYTEPLLPSIKRTRHKYDRGYLLGVAGSESMPGAALLSSLASLRSGAGMIRLYHLSEELHAPYEVIHEFAEKEKILQETQRARALFMGPGLGRSKEAKKLIHFLLHHSALPCVLDADALDYLAEHPRTKIRGSAILTPHLGEMKRLLSGKNPDLENCQTYVHEHQVTLILKGAPTFIFHPERSPLIIPRGSPGMATAGAGDVLTGVIGGLLAQGLSSYQAAISGVFLHALAGESAAATKTSHCMIASDIIDHLPDAFSLFS